MARPALVPAEQVGPHFVGATPADMAAQEGAARNHIASITESFDIDIAYDLHLFIALARNDAQQADMYLVRLGFVLAQIHGKETTDTYRDAVEQIGLTVRYADKLRMAAARLSDKKPILALGRTKALELLSEDDDALAEIAADPNALDRYDRMSVRELRDEIRRKEKDRADEKAADEEIIRSKDERINKMLRDSKRRASENDVRAKAEDLLRDADEEVISANSHLAKLRDVHAQIDQLFAAAGMTVDTDIADRIETNQRWARDQLAVLADDLGE